jgi:hypothetical protein
VWPLVQKPAAGGVQNGGCTRRPPGEHKMRPEDQTEAGGAPQGGRPHFPGRRGCQTQGATPGGRKTRHEIPLRSGLRRRRGGDGGGRRPEEGGGGARRWWSAGGRGGHEVGRGGR